MSGQLRSEELAVENIVGGLPPVQKSLRGLGGRGVVRVLGLRGHVPHCLGPEDGGGVETDMLLFPIIKGHLRVINLNGVMACQCTFPQETIILMNICFSNYRIILQSLLVVYTIKLTKFEIL